MGFLYSLRVKSRDCDISVMLVWHLHAFNLLLKGPSQAIAMYAGMTCSIKLYVLFIVKRHVFMFLHVIVCVRRGGSYSGVPCLKCHVHSQV